MKNLRLPASAIAAAIALAGCSTEGGGMAMDTAGPSCLRPAQISGWTLINQDTVIVQSGVNSYHQLDLMGPCPQFDWTRSLGFEVLGRIHRASMVCPSTPEQLNVVMPVGANLLRCPVKSLRALTPAEVAALPLNARP